MVERGFVGIVVWVRPHRLDVTCTHCSQSLFASERLFVRAELVHAFRGRQTRKQLQKRRPRHDYQTTKLNL